MAYQWTFGKNPLKLEKLLVSDPHLDNRLWCNDGVSEKVVLYRTWWKLSSLIKNYIMKGDRSPSPEI